MEIQIKLAFVQNHLKNGPTYNIDLANWEFVPSDLHLAYLQPRSTELKMQSIAARYVCPLYEVTPLAYLECNTAPLCSLSCLSLTRAKWTQCFVFLLQFLQNKCWYSLESLLLSSCREEEGTIFNVCGTIELGNNFLEGWIESISTVFYRVSKHIQLYITTTCCSSVKRCYLFLFLPCPRLLWPI